ncbi:MAG: bifunctional pyr operon transcriptional regulator/uracil phosphoribosyltransferase PyrR [Oscillospiraceae bacterium]|nr:bifunctional pyr operon transcriptional regulator/uracil phosphoribosyltransferase PyrR [Oscillospiraceae bacterium]MDD4368573.1 bifunctional pyr operon transcriptional regulator/uracil phosphoribosyltransferase PyrR [Oscillospiraceae bacterium]
MSIKARLMDSQDMDRALTRIAHEILERNKSTDKLYLVGIQRRGVPLANRIADKIAEIEGTRPGVGILDITFYRDDLSLLSENPVVNATEISCEMNGYKVVLVDDVIYTGRTVRSAIEAVFDMGRPAEIQLAVMIDRGHRELPLRPDYVGKNVPTSHREIIMVRVLEFDGMDEVVLAEDPRYSAKAAGRTED